MLNNHPTFKVLTFLIMFLNLKRHFMVWNKHLEHGTKDWVNFFWKRVLKCKKLDRWLLTVDQAVDRLRNQSIDSSGRFIFHLFSSIPWRSFTSLLLEVNFGKILDRLQAVELILGCFEARVLIWNLGCQFLGVISLWLCALSLDSTSSLWA